MNTTAPAIEIKSNRSAVHIGMVTFALLIGRIPPAGISLLCLSAFLFNLFLLPRISGRSLERKTDRERGYSLGILIYPAVLFILSLLFYQYQVFLAIGWGAMAFGDGFAAILGSRWGRHHIRSGNPKTWEGTLAFIALGSLFTYLLLLSLPASILGEVPYWYWGLSVFVSITISAFFEIQKGTIDDNLVVPVAAAFTACFLYLIYPLSVPTIPGDYILGLSIVLALTVGSIGSQKIDFGGALLGGFIALFLYLGIGYSGLFQLILFFVLGSLASQLFRQKKVQLGVAQENSGKRGIKNAFANGGVAGICGLAAWLLPGATTLFSLMAAASLAAAMADTLSSEIGNVAGKKFINILNLRPDHKGRDGVISLEGSLAGVAGSLIIALITAAYAQFTSVWCWVFAAGIVGNLLDSVLGASLQRKGFMTNHTVNFSNTLGAALFIYLLSLTGLL